MAGMTKKLKELMERAQTWPEETQEELAELGLAPEERGREIYHATEDELRAIDEADRSGVASPEDVEAAFAKFHRG